MIEPAPAPGSAVMLRALTLPLQLPVALRVVALALLASLTLLPLRFGAIGLLLAAAAALAQGLYGAAYAINLMGRTAQGFVRSAGQSTTGTHASVPRAAMLLAIGLALMAAVGAVQLLPLSMLPIWLLVVGLAALITPAAAIRQVLSDSLGAAVERGSLLEVAGKLDRRLLVLASAVLVTALLGAAVMMPAARAGGLWSLLSEAASGRPAVAGTGALLLVFALAAVHWYTVFALCGMMGRAMHTQAKALRITVIGPGDMHDVVLRPVDQRRRLRDDAVDRLAADGDLHAAIKAINNELADAPESLVLHARLHRLLKMEDYRPRIEDHAEKYLRLLVASRSDPEALALAEEALAREPQWRPRDADLVVPLAKIALAAERTALAVHLIRGFDRRHRDHPDIPAAYLLGAKVLMLQGLTQAPSARAVLEHLAASFPDSQAALEGRPLLDALDEWDRHGATTEDIGRASAMVDRRDGTR